MSAIRSLLVIVSLCLLSLSVHALPTYSVQVLPGKFFAINDRGEVGLQVQVGHDSGGGSIDDLQIWKDGVGTTLVTGADIRGADLNNAGQVAGSYGGDWSQRTVCVWSTAGRTDILTGEDAYANAINDAGHVVGNYYLVEGDERPYWGFVWNGSTVSTMTKPGAISTNLYAINNSGLMVGTVDYPTEYGSIAHSVTWSDGDIEDVEYEAFAYMANNNGAILGEAGYGSPVICSNGQMTFVSAPDTRVWAYDFNDSEQVVGQAVFSDSQYGKAAVWSNGQLADLNTLIPDSSQYVFELAKHINNSGQILAEGGYFVDDEYGGAWLSGPFLLTPVPEPSSVLMLGVGAAMSGVALLRRRARE